jgi:EAL domain-containing protein (putative c-di-GMP-specific phosphodiesterase class I)
LPIDTLKIDRSFVENIDGPESYPIIRAIVELGKHLGLTILAEGVETQEQHKELVRLGCDLLQGFLLSTPQPAREIQSLFEPAHHQQRSGEVPMDLTQGLDTIARV